MAELKTQQNDADVELFLSSIDDEQKQQDSRAVCELLHDVTGEPPKMWGSSIVGFGSYHYKYASGQEGDWLLIGFSPRKATLTIYIMDGYEEYGDLLEKLGKHKTGKSCLYIKSLQDIDISVLRELAVRSVKFMRTHY